MPALLNRIPLLCCCSCIHRQNYQTLKQLNSSIEMPNSWVYCHVHLPLHQQNGPYPFCWPHSDRFSLCDSASFVIFRVRLRVQTSRYSRSSHGSRCWQRISVEVQLKRAKITVKALIYIGITRALLFHLV